MKTGNGELNQHLFNLMHDEHGLSLLQSEMEDIKTAIRKDKAEKKHDYSDALEGTILILKDFP